MARNANKGEMLKMAKKSGTQKEFKFNEGTKEEKVYLFQHPGVRMGVQIRDRSKDQFGNLIEEKYWEQLMQHVIVKPKTDWDYWEENDGFMEVMKEAANFLNS